MWVSFHYFPLPTHSIFFLQKKLIIMFCSIDIFCLCHSVTPHILCSFLSALVILHHLQTGLCNCSLVLSCHLHILKTLLVPKLMPMVLQFLLVFILFFICCYCLHFASFQVVFTKKISSSFQSSNVL